MLSQKKSIAGSELLRLVFIYNLEQISTEVEYNINWDEKDTHIFDRIYSGEESL